MAVTQTFEEIIAGADPNDVPSFEQIVGLKSARLPIEDATYDWAGQAVATSDKTGLPLTDTVKVQREVRKKLSFSEALSRSTTGLVGGSMSMLSAAEQQKMVADIANAVAESPRDVYIGGMRFTEGVLDSLQWLQDAIEATGTQAKLEKKRPDQGAYSRSTLSTDFRKPEMSPSDIAEWFSAKASSAADVQHEVTLENAPITKLTRMVLQQGAPSLGVAIGLSALTGTPAAGYVAFFASESGSSYKELKTAGASMGKASLFAALSGAAEVGGEMLVFPKFVKGATKGIPFREAVSLITENATQEGATGFTQEFLRTFALLTTDGKSVEQALPLAFDAGVDAIPESAIVGGLTAGLFDLAVRPVSRMEGQTELQPLAGEPLPVAGEAVAPAVAEPALTKPVSEPQTVIQPAPTEAVTALAEQVVKARKVAPQIRKEQRQARREKVKAASPKVEDLIAKGMPAGEALDRSTAELRGELTNYEQRYDSIREQLGPDTVEALHRQIALDPKLPYFERLVLGGERDGILTKLIDGRALTIHEARKIGDYFGKDVGNAAASHVAYGDRFWNTFLEVLNIPRTALASMDVSGIARQGRALMESEPSLAPEFVANYGNAFASEEFARQLEATYKNDALYEEAKEAGLEMPEWGRVDVNINQLSEEFAAARFLQKVPGVRASERSFVTALNALRLAVYSRVTQETEASRGRPMTDVEKRRLTSRINNLSGRTSLPEGLQQIAPILNAVFFSPRFFMSRMAPLRDIPMSSLYSVADVVPDGPGGRPKIKRWRLEMQPELPLVMKGLAGMMATNITIMGLLNWVWGDDEDLKMEMDPRATDFGKLRYKNFRIDPGAGYVQPMRFLARMSTGTTKTASGEIREIDRGKLFRDFVRTKESPLAALLADWWTGENMVGKPFLEPSKGGWLEQYNVPGGGVFQEAWDRLAPLVIQDATDALTIQGVPEAIAGGSLAFVGVGVQTYEPSGFTIAKQKKNELAQERYQKNWDDLKPSQQARLRQKGPEIAETERAAKREAYPQQSLDLTEDVKVARRIYDSLTENVQLALNEAQVKTGVPRVILNDFFLNQTRYRKYQELAGIEMQKRVERRIATKSWSNLPPNTKAAVLQKEVENARAIARNKLIRLIEGDQL